MNDPISALREHFPDLRQRGESDPQSRQKSPDAVQMLTAKLLLFTGVGTALDALRSPGGRRHITSAGVAPTGVRQALTRPVAAGPVLLGTAAAIAHAVHAFTPSERTRLATRTFDVAVVAAGLLNLADSLAAARRDGSMPSFGSVALASAGLLGILIDRRETGFEAERHRLEQRARIVERLVPKRRPKFDRIVVHV